MELRLLRGRQERVHRTVERERGERAHMGEIVGAALVAHVPTIMLPEATRLEINDGKEITLVPGLRRLKSECLDRRERRHRDRLRHPLGVDVRAHRDVCRTADREVHEPRAAARHGAGSLRHARRPRAGHAHRVAGRRARRLLDPRLRRPVPADLLRHGERLDLPGRCRHALDERGDQPVLHHRGLPAVRAADRRRDPGIGPPGGAARERRHDAPVLLVPGAASARELGGARQHPASRELSRPTSAS